jgi:hypothetical protein
MSRKGVFFGFALAAVACLTMATAVLAQQQQPPQRPTPEILVTNLEKAVTLTADQKTQVLKIYTDAAANAQQGGRGGGFFGGGATTEAVEKVLTADQVKKWRAYTLQQNVDRRMTQIDQAVTLTDDQKTKIKPILEKEITAQTEYMTKVRAEGGTPDRDAMMAKMTELREATAKALETVLNKDQIEKYKAMPQRGGGRRQ